RKHPDPDDLFPSYFGHSIGHWEGDTLVVDTVGLNDKWWMDHRGTPHTEQMHLIERWTRTTYTTLRRVITIDDPGTFTKPFEYTATARLTAPDMEISRNSCREIIKNGFRTASTAKRRRITLILARLTLG